TAYQSFSEGFGDEPSPAQKEILDLLRPPDGTTLSPLPGPPTLTFFRAYADSPDGVTDDLLHALSPNLLEGQHQLTPLMLASLNGDLAMVRRLVEKGADPAVCRPDGLTALHFAALVSGSRLEVLIYLQQQIRGHVT